DRKNLHLVKNLMLKELQKLQSVTVKDITESQDFIEGDYLLELEDVQKVADQTLFWENVHNANLMTDFVAKVKTVTPWDVQKAVKKYLKNYTMIVLEGK
ncbi:MAG: hypothetical protein Q8R37_03525, partial [Nanoarchaeota archaeon]|nr:hypothetical protein [Nanoarchaeota archaeon]